MPTLPASLGSSLVHLGLLLLLLVGHHLLLQVQPLIHNLIGYGLLLHYLVLGLDIVGHWLLVNLQALNLLGLRKLALF